ncbi:pentafunctional AROM polypeptide [Capsaspora owczarzaki ATCC 30864]|uniref:3-phosphoshikimate 1-carboxyvinyltransferase n=1 Tax=Capsaspora owczarzaki (strain ATCC 30864) TaxID=595528 RepID=A0A0D2U9X2_CAPO3|nr:pentafunctional AROM polypeptide [Capsaspora owczarzaki ATCC 30864]KJE91861.1 pentafunctional AROM polypeptide [Capsaspora owczarzaki ATCC 30864]|eukprot:XP_004363769.1 pentafunctional AROM polypeptide [Capsaspora owczarzaki ATCC 30864]
MSSSNTPASASGSGAGTAIAAPLPPQSDPSPSGVSVVGILGHDAIRVGHDLLASIPDDLCRSLPSKRNGKFVIVTDETVAALWLQNVVAAFARAGLTVESGAVLVFVLPPGEVAKTRESKSELEDLLIAKRCDRSTCLIALGGGVVGDLVGYTAASFMRGVPVVQLPTTLLAMVDSSIGGKTGLDTPLGKNPLGAFHQPHRIYLNLRFLESLPDRQLSNGMAEVIKTAAFCDAQFFQWLESNVEHVFARSPAALKHVVLECAAVKARVVTEDEKEITGMRSLLNFGHTIGHAVEALCQPEMLHGEAVSIGMIKEAEIARSLGLLSQANLARLSDCLDAYELPTQYPAARLPLERVMAAMAFDKKNQGGTKSVVLLSGIGSVVTLPNPQNKRIGASQVTDDTIRRVLSSYVQVVPGAVQAPVAPPPSSSATAAATAAAAAATTTTTAATPLVAESVVQVPGSKSISNRVLLLAALGTGTCRIRGLLHSDDTRVMLQALKSLGVHSEFENEGTVLAVRGAEGLLTAPQDDIYLGNAGTAARFLTSVAALVCSAAPTGGTSTARSHVVLTGKPRMKERPNGPLISALVANGASIECLEKPGCLPIRVACAPSAGSGTLRGGDVELAANISSQYVSSLLISAPYTQQPVRLRLVGGEVVSQLYIDMTLALMKDFGVPVAAPVAGSGADPVYQIPTAKYANPPEYAVEGDASSATYPLAIAAVTGKKVTVANVGKLSLQGDAQFCHLLARMGCTVEQTDMTTTVTGPSGIAPRLRALGTVDMGDMTDAFMTLAAVCAIADGVTSIRNIANQRVKECNRILVMLQELTKMGIHVVELEDGLEIHGRPASELHGATIVCHDDHRIAMSFAVLGCVVPNVIISERACVEKTYPEFWDDLTLHLGVGVQAPLSTPESRTPTVDANRQSLAELPIVMVGMRGAGKSTLGAAVAALDSRQFIDLDELIVSTALGGVSILDHVAAHGWESFRRAETQTLRGLLVPFLDGSGATTTTTTATTTTLSSGTSHSKPLLIACGGGVVETEAARQLLAQFGRVVLLHRHTDDVVAYLLSDKTRPTWNEHPSDIYARRLPLYRACSQYEFVISRGDSNWTRIARELHEFVRFISQTDSAAAGSSQLLYPSTQPSWPAAGRLTSLDLIRPNGWLHPTEEIRTPTGFLSLTFADLTEPALTNAFRPIVAQIQLDRARQAQGVLRQDALSRLILPSRDPGSLTGTDILSAICEQGVHAIELRVDLLDCWRDATAVAEQVACLRRITPLGLPIIYTVRSVQHGGKFDGKEADWLRLTLLGIRLGCAYVDVETTWSASARETVLKALSAANTRVIGSYHVPVGWGQVESIESSTPDAAVHLLRRAAPGLSGRVPVHHSAWNALRGRFEEARLGDRAHIVKVIARAGTVEDNYALAQLAASIQACERDVKAKPIPTLTLCMGDAGSLSRATSTMMTPFTHPLLPFKAAPGQLSLPSLHQLRNQIGLLPQQQFVLLGSPIQRSMSPTLHNAAFDAVGLPHRYSLCETSSADVAVQILLGGATLQQEPLEFAGAPVHGASVTIPLKQDLVPHMHSLSKAAEVIGAINTVSCLPAPVGHSAPKWLHGDNTDWLGILHCLARATQWPVSEHLLTKPARSAHGEQPISSSASRTALVLGAGGTARAAMYALAAFGMSTVYVHNRTAANAEQLAADFSWAYKVEVVQDLARDLVQRGVVVNVVLATVPTSAGVTIPDALLEQSTPATPPVVVLDVAYIPPSTALLEQAARHNCTIIRGIDMLIEQGFAQFELWHALPAPRSYIRSVVLDAFERMCEKSSSS